MLPQANLASIGSNGPFEHPPRNLYYFIAQGFYGQGRGCVGWITSTSGWMRICYPGVAALAGGMPAGTAACCPERLIQLINIEKILQAAERCIECTLLLLIQLINVEKILQAAERCIECTLLLL
ncbi:MAG: hypothetical protein ACLFVO_26260, partial [Chloroflexaceae bacterium]